MSACRFAFAQCVIDTDDRTVLREGRAQQVERRVLDLLVYLIRHRDRVVSNDELLDQVWKTRFVTPGVISTAIARARRAIDTAGQGATLIRTYPRVGYRFVGELVEPAEVPAAAAKPAEPGGRQPPSLALLPFEPGTGPAHRDWVDRGLMSRCVKLLEACGSFRMPATASLTMALDSVAPDAGFEERADAVRRLLGVRHVVGATIGSGAAGYCLQYEFASSGAPPRRIVHADMAQLAVRLVADLESVLCGPAPGHPAFGLASDDPFVHEILARALKLSSRQEWQQAARLFRVALDVEPDNLELRCEYLRALIACGDAAAHDVATRLRADAARSGNAAVAAQARRLCAAAVPGPRRRRADQGHAQAALQHAEE